VDVAAALSLRAQLGSEWQSGERSEQNGEGAHRREITARGGGGNPIQPLR
jgi:hypothetical protein